MGEKKQVAIVHKKQYLYIKKESMEKFKKGEKLYLQVEVEFDSYDKHDEEIVCLKIESSYAHEYIEFINPKLIRKEYLDKK